MVESITSHQNARIKNAVKLRDRRARDKQQRIIIDGAREIRRAMSAGVEFAEVFFCSTASRDNETLLDELRRNGTKLLSVAKPIFEKLAFGDRVEGIVAVAKPPRRTLADLTLGENPLLLVIESVEKPGNVGAIVRSADAAGVSAVIVADGGTDLFNPNSIRASLGTIFTLPVAAAGSRETIDWLREKQIVILPAKVDGAVCYWDADLTGSVAVVLGSESRGLSDEWQGPNMTAISLPQLGIADSLNVSATAAVIAYEARRQRTAKS